MPTLAALLDSENKQIRKNAIYILSQIAHEYPEEVKPVVPQLIASLEDRDETYRTNALSALVSIVSAYPAAGTETTETLTELAVSNAAPKVRGNALGLLGDIAVEYPGEIVDHVPVLVENLAVDDEYIVGNAVAALLHVAVDDAEAVDQAIPHLIEHLDHPSPAVRRNVCRTLGKVDALVALEQLKSTAESDPNEGVRAIASQAIDRIS